MLIGRFKIILNHLISPTNNEAIRIRNPKVVRAAAWSRVGRTAERAFGA
jgi:hypothetical protein